MTFAAVKWQIRQARGSSWQALHIITTTDTFPRCAPWRSEGECLWLHPGESTLTKVRNPFLSILENHPVSFFTKSWVCLWGQRTWFQKSKCLSQNIIIFWFCHSQSKGMPESGVLGGLTFHYFFSWCTPLLDTIQRMWMQPEARWHLEWGLTVQHIPNPTSSIQ